MKIMKYENPKNPIAANRSCAFVIGNSVKENAPNPKDKPKTASIIVWKACLSALWCRDSLSALLFSSTISYCHFENLDKNIINIARARLLENNPY